METSAGFISDVTEAILPELEKWQNRALCPVYPVVFFDAIRIKTRGENGVVTPRAVPIALGVDTDGKKDVLGLWMSENESAKYWLKVFNELKNRGVSDILIAVTDEFKGMKEARETAFPETMLQTCIVHLIRGGCGRFEARLPCRERRRSAAGSGRFRPVGSWGKISLYRKAVAGCLGSSDSFLRFLTRRQAADLHHQRHRKSEP